MFVSADEVIVRPLLPPTSTHSPYTGPKQRLYLSATIGAGGELRLTTKVADRTHYSIAVDYRKAYDALTDESVRNEIKLALDQNVSSSVAEIELDTSGLPTLIKFSTPFQNAVIVDEARFSDWGGNVQITDPPADEISPRI